MLPFILSPYLRPLLREGRLHIDDYLTGRTAEVPQHAEAVVRALWTSEPARAAAGLARLTDEQGADAVAAALAHLAGAGLLFRDRADAERAFAAHLSSQVQHVPFVDQIELTNRCPMRCGFCPRGVPGRMARPLGMMDLGLFERLLAQLHPYQAHYRPLELHHLGESLLHPRAPDFVAAAAARGLPTELSANPALLTPELARRLLDAGLTRLVLSLDGMDDQTLVAIRGPAAPFGKSARHLDALLALVAAHPRPPTVVIQMIDLSRNRHQRAAFLARYGALGLPNVHAYVKDLDGPDPDTGVGSARPQLHLCSYPFRSVVVLWDGRVVPCCRDDDAHLVLGDLNEQPLAQIWQGPAALALREAHAGGGFPQGHLCDGCAWGRERFTAAMDARHPDTARDEPLRW